jgi:serine/threonine-protein kinase
MATVHLGRDRETARVVAIKRLHPHLASDPEFVKMFLDEARVAAHISHPNVIHTLDTVVADDEVLLVMDYVPGESLARLVRGRKPPSYRATVAIVRDVLFGLHAAHEAADESGWPLAIVHRDVSPENVLVGTDGIARLLDFGVAKAVGRGQRTTEPGELKGKLAFMAPEVLESGTVSPRTDIYAMGVVLWELVTGKRMLRDETPGVVVKRILGGEIPELMSVALAKTARKLSDAAMIALENLSEIILRAVSADPEERYPSADAMANDVARALEPAAPQDIGAWVMRIAHDMLASRAQVVADLESAEEPDESPPDSEPPTLVGDASLPIIVADLADASALEALEEIAVTRSVALVPLLNPPADATDHVLEVMVPGLERPARFVARPVGPPEEGGFPLALRVLGQARDAGAPKKQITGRFTARSESHRVLDAPHTRGLMPSAPLIEPELIGRVLAVQGGKIVLQERLGSGGGGAVFRGHYVEFTLPRKDVAVKVMHPPRSARQMELYARFHAEALAASKLDHRNLVRIIDFGQEPDGLLYLMMELIEGKSARQQLDEEGPMLLDRVVKLGLHVCAGLAHAHRRGVVHRDVKPSNVVIVTETDDDGRPIKLAKICDFGIATGPALGEPGDGWMMGTPQYMSPEQCRGQPVDPRTDIYSCAVMLYELATGRLPFEGRDDRDFLRLHELASPTPPSTHVPGIDPLFEQIILQCLEKSPDARFASMFELRHALKELREPVFIEEQRSSLPAAPVSVPASGVRLPEDEQRISEQPIEHSLEGLVGLLQSLAEVPNASAERLAELEKKTVGLERVVGAFAARADAVALMQVIRAMDALHEKAARANAAETWTVTATTSAQRLLHTIADPASLVPAADKLLATEEPSEELLSLIVWSKVAGAHALYTARSKIVTPVARTRFVSAMRLIGAAAVPIVRSALEFLWLEGGANVEELVVDLMRSVPGTRDDELGVVVSRWARCSNVDVQGSALSTLVHAWGDRATPALLAGMQSADPGVQAIAVRGLRTVSAVDDLVVRKIDWLLGDGVATSADLHAAAAEALGYASSAARPLAARVALRMLATTNVTNEGVLAFARAALALSPAEAKTVIEARAARGPEALRGALRALK